MFNGAFIPARGFDGADARPVASQARDVEAETIYALSVATKGSALVFVGALGLASCRSEKSTSPAEVSAGEGPAAGGAAVLPDPCVDFLRKVRCWLRAAGNDAAEVDRAVGNARASFEARPQPAEACERASVFRAELIASAGCAHAGGDSSKLPAAVPVECPTGEYFFMRRDGHVSGCHRDCALPADCPDGSRCASVGSAADGPIDEPFCE
jgi:hypothetical protein